MDQTRALKKRDKSRFFNRKTFVHYTIIFLLVYLFTLGLFLVAGKSFIWLSDPYHQHLPAAYYFSSYLREAVRNLLQGKIYFPTFDLSIGYGSDILTSLNYYAFGDPLNLIYALFKPKYAEYVYIFLASFRLYLAGLSFLGFTRYFKKNELSEILGALVYCFSGFAIISATLHPFFLNAMIYFPIVLLGVEKIFREKKPAIFILMVALSLISNFYFAYMILLLSFIYALVRYFFYFKNKSISHFFITIGKFIFFVIDSLLLSAIIFLPVLIGFLSNGRSEVGKVTQSVFYPISYYLEVFQNMFSPTTGGTASSYWSNISLASISFFAITTCLFIKKKRILNIYFILAIVSLCLPVMGKVFNGFSYVTNRWLFAFIFLVSYMVSYSIPLLSCLSKKEIMKISFITLIYCCVIFLLQPFYNANTLMTVANLLFIILVISMIYIQDSKSLKFNNRVLVFFSLVSMVLLLSYKIMPLTKNYFELGSAVPMIKDSSERKVKSEDNYFKFRVASNDSSNIPKSYNSSLINGVNGLSSYYSLVPQETMDFINELNSSDQRAQIILTGLDDRLYLQTLFSTKYYTTNNSKAVIPYGYEKKNGIVSTTHSNEKVTYSVYESKYSLPLAYSYRNTITNQEFDSLSPLEKQDTLLNSVAVENPDKRFLKSKIESNVDSKDFSIVKTDGVAFKSNKLIVDKPNATMTIKFNGEKNSESYFYIKGIKNLQVNSKLLNEKRDFERLRTSYLLMYQKENQRMGITAKGVRSNYRTIYSKENKFYLNEDRVLINVGYSKKAQDTITVKFNSAGSFTFDKIEVLTQSMDNLEKQVSELKKEPINIKKIVGNSIEGSLDFSEPRFLSFSIPYSKGWTLYVDGVKKPLQKANIMFMGAVVESGKHKILLHYETPGLKLGVFGTILGLLLFAGVLIYHHRVKSEKQK